jgi:hypothetical protein
VKLVDTMDTRQALHASYAVLDMLPFRMVPWHATCVQCKSASFNRQHNLSPSPNCYTTYTIMMNHIHNVNETPPALSNLYGNP